MLKKPLLIVALLGACFAVQAQSTPAKKELVGRILKVQQPSIENVAKRLAEEPAMRMLAMAEQALPRVAADKQQAVAKEIEADAKKYVDETVPLVRDRAMKLAPTTVGALLEEKFTEEELKQIVGFLENPAVLKFQQLAPEMQKALTDKLVADMRPTVEPKIKALDQSIAKRLGVPPATNGAAKPPQQQQQQPAKK